MAIDGFPNLDLGGSSTTALEDQTGPIYDFSDYNSDKASSELDKWDFMTLFLEQIQNQDPLNPMESYEMAAQLAQYSALEQQMKTNEWLETMAAYEQSINSAQSIALLGKKVTALGELVVVKDGAPTPISYALGADANVTVNIYDAYGSLVRTLDQGKELSGYHTWTWDGKDDQGEAVEDGNYTFEVVAKDDDGETVEAGAVCTSIVSGVQFDDDGNPQILIGPEVEDMYDEEGDLIDPRILVTYSDILEIASNGSDANTETETESGTYSKVLAALRGKAGDSLTRSTALRK